MGDSTLLLALDEIRRKTLLLLEGVDERAARFSPPGLQNSILWHAGHCYVLLEWLGARALGAAPHAPEGWYEIFSWNSRPGEVSEDRWPRLDEVIRELRIQHGRVRKLLQKTPTEQLHSPSLGGSDQTALYRVLHALHDEACHSGEIWLLRKLLAKGAAAPR